VANLFDDDVLSFDAELKPVISGSQPVPTSQITTQRLGSADFRPFAKPLEQLPHPCPDDPRQSVNLPLHFRTHQDVRHSSNPIPL